MKIRKNLHLPPGQRMQSTRSKLPLFEKAPGKAVSTGKNNWKKLRGTFRDTVAHMGEWVDY